jgi:hypothetical protein
MRRGVVILPPCTDQEKETLSVIIQWYLLAPLRGLEGLYATMGYDHR